MQEVVKKEIFKLLKADVIYPISDSKWVSPVPIAPKKRGMTVVKNENNEFIPTRTVTGWRMCIHYRKLNKATCKDRFPLSCINQMLERLVRTYIFTIKMGTQVPFKYPSILVTKKRLSFHVLMVHMHIGECHLGCAMPPSLFNVV